MNENVTQEFENDIGSWDWVEQVEKHVPAISAAELMEMTIEPMEFVVREILAPGLSMLGGAPKCGKSWFVLDLCVHVATGEPFLGFPVTKGSAWYISLEDTKEDLYWRLDAITDKELPNLFLSTEDDPIGNLEDGLEKHLNNFIEQHKDMKLIVIDTFQLARGTNRESNYPNDYADTQKLKKIADKHKVAILLVHHLRKMHDPDPVNMLSGSTGLSGGVAGNFTIRLTGQEYEAVMKKVLRSGMSMTDFLVTAAQQTQIHVAEDTKPLVTELKRIGNNLNQITARINAGIFHSYNFQEVIDLQRAIYEEVLRIGRGD